MHSRTLYQTESLELLRLNYHHSNATFLDPSAPLLLSYVRVTAGSSTFTRPASLQVWLMFARTVEWHHTPLNICSSALPTWQNSQLKTYKTIQTRWLIFSSSTTTNEGEELWATTTTTPNRQRDRQTDGQTDSQADSCRASGRGTSETCWSSPVWHCPESS